MGQLKTAMVVILMLQFICTPGYTGEAASPQAKPAVKPKEDNRLPIHKQDQWQFFFAPYMWVSGVNTKTTVLDHTTTVSEPWWDILAKLFSNAMGVMGRFEVWKGRWGFFVDSYFTYLSGNVSDSAARQRQIDLGRRLQIPVTLVLNGDLKYITRAGNVDFGPRYLIGTVPLVADKPLPVLSFEVLGGGRFNVYSQYLKLNLDASLSGPLRTRTAGGSFVSKFERSYIEPMLGMRLGLWLTENAVLVFRGTVGGFGLVADNNLDSDMELSFGYKVHRNIYAYAGYRARFDTFDQGDNIDLSFSGWFHGPILGAVFAF